MSRIEQITAVAIDWFGTVTREIGAAIEDRAQKLASAPPVLAAIGAMGHSLLDAVAGSERERIKERLVEQLKSVCWTKGKAWEGVAGKFTSKGSFSVGGTKETAYAIYSALSDPKDPAYSRIRGGEPAAPVPGSDEQSPVNTQAQPESTVLAG
jgi:DNA sulfur modification protein DndB